MKTMEHLTPSAKPIASPANREIVAHLERYGPVKLFALEARFRNLALAQGKGAPHWLVTRLNDLREAGHVHRLLDAHGNACWDVVRESDAKELPEAPPENVAQPRRVSMFGPEWVPPKGPAMRPGAMDYATVPSLHMGQRRPFRSGL
jgi:hypothetical protein